MITSSQLSSCKETFRLQGVEELLCQVCEILGTRGLNPDEHPGLVRGMVMRVVNNVKYDLDLWRANS